MDTLERKPPIGIQTFLNVFDGLMFDNYWFQTGTPIGEYKVV